MKQYSYGAYFADVYRAVQQCFPLVAEWDARAILRETILGPDDYEVEYGSEILDKHFIMEKLAYQLIENCTGGKPQELYTILVEEAADVIKCMNNGYISTDDFALRSSFIEKTSKLAFILFISLAFLKSSLAKDEAVCRRLVLNVRRLREIKDLILSYTREAVEEKVELAEYENAKPIYKLLKSLKGLGYEYSLSQKERSNLGINHEADKDLSLGYDYVSWLRCTMLLQLRFEDEAMFLTNDSVTDGVLLSDDFDDDEDF